MQSRIARYLPFLQWPRLTLPLFRNEAVAGLSVGLVMLPQCVAYAQLAGMPAVTGIYAALLPALIAVLFSASARLSVGPTALTALIISVSLTPLAQPGTERWISLAIWLALMSGLVQAVLGLARFGWLLNVVNTPVLIAFTQAAAVLIICSQLPALLGLDHSWAQWLSQPNVHWSELVFGLIALMCLILAWRFKPTFPSVLIVVVLASLISYLTGFKAHGGRVVGTLPKGLPMLQWPPWLDWHDLGQLVLPSLVVAMVSFLETASSARADNHDKGTRWQQNQDLFSQGLAKMASAFSGSFATSASFSRSALSLYAGAQTGWSAAFAVVVVLVSLLLFTPVLYHVPHAVLAAIVVAAVVGLIRPREFVRLWRISRVEAAIAAATFVVTLATAPALYWGVITGVLGTLSLFIFQRLHLRIAEVGAHPEGGVRDRQRWQLSQLTPNCYALRMDASLDFTTAGAFERAITDHLSARPQTRHLCWFAQPINHIDATGAEAFARVSHQLLNQGRMLHIVGLKLPIEKTLRSAGTLQPHPRLHMYRTDMEAIAALHRLADSAPE